MPFDFMPLPLSPFLKTLPTYQPGRPIEEVARELGLPADRIIKSRRMKIRSARRRSRSPRCKKRLPA